MIDQALGCRVKDIPKIYQRGLVFQPTSPAKELGLEFEVEGGKLPTQTELKYHWIVERDGSLRGPSAEFVLKRPMSYKYFTEKALPYLTKWTKRKKSSINMSGRCSTHVHVNMQGLYGYQALLVGVLYHMFEDLVPAFVTKDRMGNLFCVGSQDIVAIGDYLNGGTRNLRQVTGSAYRYSAVNFTSLTKYGSLEFRALQGTLDPKTVDNWLNFLLSLRDYAATVDAKDIPNILGEVSDSSVSSFVKKVITRGDSMKVIQDYVKTTGQSLDSLVYQGIDRVQSFFYEPDWDSLVIYDSLKPFDVYLDSLNEVLDNKEDLSSCICSMQPAAYDKSTRLLAAQKIDNTGIEKRGSIRVQPIAFD